MARLNPDKELQRAQREYQETIATCYIFLTKNGMKREHVKVLLMDTLLETIGELEE